MRSRSQGIKAWSLLRASRGSASVRALSGVFQVKTKIFRPPALSHSLVHSCATSAGGRRYSCSEEERGWLTLQHVAWCQELRANHYLVPDQVVVSWFLICEAMHYRIGCVHLVLPEGGAGRLCCLLQTFLTGSQLSTGCRWWKGAPDCT